MMTADTDRATGLDEWRAGWLVVVTACLGIGFTQIHFILLGFTTAAIEKDLGWSRGDVTMVGLIFSLLLAAVAPFAGRLIDRVRDERWVGVPANAGYCLLTALLSQAGPGIESWWAIWAGIALISPPASVLFWTTVIARRFDRQRGLALGGALCGTAFATAILSVTAYQLIEAYGWRGTYLRIGLVSALVIAPLTLLVLRPGQRLVVPAGLAGAQKFSWSEALRSPQFIRIALAGTVLSITAAGIAVHFVPALIEWGVPKQSAAIAIGLTGVGALFGRLGTGALLDRSKGPLIGALVFTIPILPCLAILGLPPLPATALLMGILFGLASGGEVDVVSFFTARYFGAARYASVYGAAYAFIGAAAGIGPWAAGLAYDATGSYTKVFAAVIPMALLAALLLLTMGPYPPRDEE
jgi:predicted MFS family arabinose efflux permease